MKLKHLLKNKETKKQVTIRLPIRTIEKLKTLRKYTDKSNIEILTNALDDYLAGKTLTNDYLANDKNNNIYLKIPLTERNKYYVTAKQIKEDKISILKGKDLINDDLGLEENETISYYVQCIPNNLDTFDTLKLSYNTVFEDRIGHAGLDYVIIPKLATEHGMDNEECLNIVYFKYHDGKTEAYLMHYTEALKILNERNSDMKNHIDMVLLNLHHPIETVMLNPRHPEYSKDSNVFSTLDKNTLDKNLERVASIYTTGNFRELGIDYLIPMNPLQLRDRVISDNESFNEKLLKIRMTNLIEENEELKYELTKIRKI